MEISVLVIHISLFIKGKIITKETTERGPLRPSCTCTRGQGPWTHLGEIASLEEKTASASFAGVTKSLWASGPRKTREILRGRASFPPQDFPCFPRMLCIWEGVFDAGPEAITSPSRVYLLSTAGVCFLAVSSGIRLCGVQGDHPPGQVWAESPA